MAVSTPRASRRALVPLAAGLAAGAAITLGITATLDSGTAGVPDSDVAGARSVILINGDGMSAAHREAARLQQVGLDGELAMGSMPVSGWQTTHSADPDELVTDSAAAATAWATGEKTYNGAISVDVDGEPLPTLGAEAEESGRATGLVTTADVTDASPAAFFSNAESREDQDEILRDYLDGSGPDVILGGGRSRWVGGNGSDFVGQAQEQGYEYVTDADELAAAEGDQLLGLFAEEALYGSGSSDSEYESPVPLADMTAKALDVLSQDEDGFFLLVEEEGVDAASHNANGAAMLDAMSALDAAVEVAREYVADHPDTLLIVTGDHDAGGLAVEEADDPEDQEPSTNGPFPVAGSDGDFVLDWTSSNHTGAPTPVTAEGPGSGLLADSYPNTFLHEVMRQVLVD